jgi:hypothetical protein
MSGQVERMNRTIKEATVKRFHYDDHGQRRDISGTMTFKEISNVTPGQREILLRHLPECRIKLGQLTSDLGVSVKVSSLRIGISGQISLKGNQYAIRINRNEYRERQRFIIERELAHFMLHKDVIDSSP